MTLDPSRIHAHEILGRLGALDLVPDEVPREKYDKETAEQYRERLALRMKPRIDRWMALTPKLYAEATLDKLDERQDPAGLMKWLDSDSTTLFLAGAIGTGKTFAAYALGRAAAVDHLLWVEAWNAVNMLEALVPGAESAATWAAVLECDLLILDDLAAPKVTDWAAQTMYRIADKRVNECRRQVVTTNGSYVALIEKWGTPTMDRFAYRQMTVKMVGESRRTMTW